jgi:hydroxysqualene synthase
MSAAQPSSGKNSANENFPVASVLIEARHRPAIMAFYRFARAADDVADAPDLAANDKLRGLAQFEATLRGESDSVAEAVGLRDTLRQRELDPQHPLDLLTAFRADATKNRYASWDELMDYCRYSAAPVGRFVLDVHGESRALWPANDVLCAALQIINHLQDCAKDYAALDRVYLPQDALDLAGAKIIDLSAPNASPQLLKALAGLAIRTDRLLDESEGFSASVRNARLGLEIAVIQRVARSLAKRLAVADPLCQKVHLGKYATLAIGLQGILHGAAHRTRRMWLGAPA